MYRVRHEKWGTTVTNLGDPQDYNFSASHYAAGVTKPNYPMPALLQDSETNLAKRWASWMDDDRLNGHRY